MTCIYSRTDALYEWCLIAEKGLPKINKVWKNGQTCMVDLDYTDSGKGWPGCTYTVHKELIFAPCTYF